VSAQFAILNPCSKRWSDLTGPDHKRFCPSCQTYVHALDGYTSQELAAIEQESGGHVCAYLEGESLPEPRSRRAVLLGALLTAISPLMAQSGRVRIRVTDATGAVVPLAEASQLDESGKVSRTLPANNLGEIVVTGLPVGNARFRVECTGFKSLPLTVTVRNEDELKVDARLEVGTMGTVVTVEMLQRESDGRPTEPNETLTLPLRNVPLPVSQVSTPRDSQPPKKRKRWFIF
jgi:carboxypeptidase family protein